MFSSALFDKVDDCADDNLICYILDIILWPLKRQKRDFVDIPTVFYLFSGTVDDMGNFVGLEKIDILNERVDTWAMWWSAMKMPSTILIGMENVHYIR